MEIQQPSGWSACLLEEIVLVLDYRRIPINNSDRQKRNQGKEQAKLFPYFGATGQTGWIDDFIFDEEIILLGEDGVPFFDPCKNKAYMVKEKCWVNNHAHVLKPIEEACDSRYLLHYLNQFDYRGLVTGSTRLKLNQKAMRGMGVNLAPLNEQRRIADKLDATLAAVEACKQKLNNAAETIQRFRQSVLAAAVSGELTREWREERGLEGEWSRVVLSDHIEKPAYGTSSKSSPSGSVPVLRMGNIQNMKLDWTELAYTSDTKEIERYELKKGDVLFNRTNSPELVGKTAIYNGERQAIYAGYLIRVRCKETLLPDYLNLSLNSPQGRHYCWKVKSDGVSQSNINSKKLCSYEFGLPTMREQKELCRQAISLLVEGEEIEARIHRSLQVLDNLTKSLLAKAFRGELIAQDPNDEPASLLLERIKDQRQREAERKKSAKNKGKARSVV